VTPGIEAVGVAAEVLDAALPGAQEPRAAVTDRPVVGVEQKVLVGQLEALC
jgi:hypothetical protein